MGIINSTEKKPVKIEVIQALRGIAAFIIMVYHLKPILIPNDPFKKEIDFLFNSGPAGVDLFFIISGFIMVLITRKLPGTFPSTLEFFIKRIIRIWPLYIFATIYYLIITYRFSLDQIPVLKAIDSLLFIPLENTDPPYWGYPSLSVGWSLNYEIYFYILTALSLSFGKYRWYFFSFMIITTLIVIPVLYGTLTLDPTQNQLYKYPYLNLITNPVIWNFVYGILIGLLYNSELFSAHLSNLFSSVHLLFIIVMLAIWQYLSGFFAGHGPDEWGFSMAVLFTALLFYSRNKAKAYPYWLVYLGEISFSIYLWHLPVYETIKYCFGKLAYPAYSSGITALLLSVSATLFVSHLSYKYLEQKSHLYLLKAMNIK
ncbi:acyltransferase [Dyadobacter flavalbus]|uniref:Acyltransferase n=1 Tax=Dyadobacter flavalbus TaxID=2579942 RepID=A0A5M8QC56_9BACT|nr:acyltransferase [Dyadobacter flavalbus]KAA6432738.1 acyltransferase [Dyadobacter flavalbus]